MCGARALDFSLLCPKCQGHTDAGQRPSPVALSLPGLCRSWEGPRLLAVLNTHRSRSRSISSHPGSRKPRWGLPCDSRGTQCENTQATALMQLGGLGSPGARCCSHCPPHPNLLPVSVSRSPQPGSVCPLLSPGSSHCCRWPLRFCHSFLRQAWLRTHREQGLGTLEVQQRLKKDRTGHWGQRGAGELGRGWPAWLGGTQGWALAPCS